MSIEGTAGLRSQRRRLPQPLRQRFDDRGRGQSWRVGVSGGFQLDEVPVQARSGLRCRAGRERRRRRGRAR